MRAYESQVAERKRLKRLKKRTALKAARKANEQGMAGKEEAEEGEEEEEEDPVPIDPQPEIERVEGGSQLAVVSESGKDSQGYYYWIDNWHPKPEGVSVNDIPDATPNSYFKVCIFFSPGVFLLQ